MKSKKTIRVAPDGTAWAVEPESGDATSRHRTQRAASEVL